MSLLGKLRVIAEAKFSDKSKLGDWYKKRMEICELCPINSKNKKELTFKEQAIVAANLGKPACLACGCEIAAKASVRDEQCGLAKRGEEPLWKALPEIPMSSFGGIKVENLSPEKVNMISSTITVFDYGLIDYNSDTNIQFSVEGEEFKMTRVKIQTSCQCTSVKTQEDKGKFTFRVNYNSKTFGPFNKSVFVTYYREGLAKRMQFRLIGEVKS